VTIVWTFVGIKGIYDWKKVAQPGGISYNNVAMLFVFLKFFIMYMGILWGSSNTLIFLIFWLQISQNVVSCYVIHSVVQNFHKRKSCIGKFARGFYTYQLFSLTFQITYALAIYNSFN